MDTFIETISLAGGVAAAIVCAVIALTLFFRVLAWFGGDGAKPESIAVRGVLKKDTYATVHLVGNETFERVRLVGFTTAHGTSAHLPFDLGGMVILEDERKKQYLVRAKNIKMIEVEARDAVQGLDTGL